MEAVVAGGNTVHVLLELGELACGVAALIGQDVRGQHEGVAVLDVGGDEVVQQRPLQLRAQIGVEPVAVAGQLHAALIVDQAEARAQIDMVLGLKVKNRLLAKHLDDLVVLLAARNNVVRRQVGQRRNELLDLRLDLTQFLVQALDLFTGFLHLRHDGRNIGAFLLQARDLLVDAVALRLERLALGDDLLAASVPLQQLGEIHLVFALGKRRLDELRILTDQIDVQHALHPPSLHNLKIKPVPNESGRA